MKKTNREQEARKMMSKAVGPRIWAGVDLGKAFLFGFFFGFVMFYTTDAIGAPIEHNFKSPSFNGVNQSSHYLTIENQETSRKQALKLPGGYFIPLMGLIVCIGAIFQASLNSWLYMFAFIAFGSLFYAANKILKK